MTDAFPITDEIDANLAPKWVERRPRQLRVLYRQERDPARRETARQGLWVAVIIYMLFSITDILLIPDVAIHTIGARVAISVAVLAVLEVQVRRKVRTKWLDLTCAGAIVAGYASWLLPAMTTQHIETFSYYMVFGAIFMLGANLFFKFQFRLSLLCAGSVLATFFAALFYFPATDAYRLAFGTFYISCFVFSSFVNWNLNRERYHVFLNALDAKNQQKEATERGKALLRLSRTDPLTGLENRRAIDEKLRSMWNDWQKHGKSFSAILIDVDFFKKFNDFYGHQEGDRCLVLVGSAIEASIVPYNGTIGRFGGEEFIVLAHLDTPQHAAQLAEHIRRTVEDLGILHEHRRDGMSNVTISVGAAFTRHPTGAKLEKLIHEADRALYLAKASGRNCAKLFDPEDPQAEDENENIAALLKIAIAQNLVSLVYQPILNLNTRRVESVEALMRLKMLDGTSVPPSLFIPIAERTGAIIELGRWVIRTVCRELLAGDHIDIVSVNVSPVQLKTPGFAATVASILGETGVRGNRLAFEITEGLEMEMHSDVLRCINDLKLLGIQIWLDDFGTGFAGLSWLRLIEFDTVKIDRSFLHDSNTQRGKAMLQDIIALIRNRGHKILVEGVETEEQLALMRLLAIDQVQGFHVGRPAVVERYQTNTVARTPQLRMTKSA